MNIIYKMAYAFGIPGPAIWITHVLIGLFLVYIGYTLLIGTSELDKRLIILLIVLGSLAMLYHLHLYYYYTWGEGKK
jgi:hypothetical protein